MNEEMRALLTQLVGAINTVLESGEELSDEFQGMLAETLANLTQRSEQPPPNDSGGIVSVPPSNDAELLWILAGQQPQAFISYLRTFETSSTRELLANPEQLNATIVQLQQTMPQGEQPVIDGIQHADLNSSNVWGASYNDKNGKMRVRFQGGSIYEYDGIPPAIFDAFIHGNASAKTKGQNRYGRWWPNKNPSLGAALNQYIKKGGFQYRKVR